MKTLSIVIPCYNEESGIENLHTQLTPVVNELEKEWDVDLIFVDDGSIDNTNQLLHQFFPNGTIIKHEINKNLGAALKTGFAKAEGDFIATIDSDCSFPPTLILKMLPMFDENTDIVTVSAFHPDGSIESTEKWRIFLSKSASSVYRILLNSGIYSHGGLTRIYKKKVLDTVKFKADDFLSVTEIIARAVLQGYKVKECPASLRKREFGSSKMKLIPVIKSHALFIVKIFLHRTLGTKL